MFEKVHLPVDSSPVDVKQLASYEAALRRNGVVVLTKVFSADLLDQLTQEFDKNWKEVQDSIETQGLSKSSGVYLNSSIPKSYGNQPSWTLQDGTLVLDLAKGRLDFTHGMDRGLFTNPKFFNHPLIMCLIWRLLKCDWTHYNGALPSFSSEESGSAAGPWHRDTYSLFEDDQQDLSLPPFYMTLIVPLQDVTSDLGPTEFVVGSHSKSWSESLNTNTLEHFLATSTRGDCVLFDGRMIHRGTPCLSKQPRRAIYTVFHKKWYSDYVDNQFPASANAHGAPNTPILPSGFQVDVDIGHPTPEDPRWRVTVSNPVSKGELVWAVGKGDSMVFTSQDEWEKYMDSLSSIEAKKLESKTEVISEGLIVVRRDWAALVTESEDASLANAVSDKLGNWKASMDIEENCPLILLVRKP